MSSLDLDHCVIGVSDWDTSNRFYRDVVGAEIIMVDERRWAYKLAGTSSASTAPGVDVSDNVARLPVQPGNSDLCLVWPGPVTDAIAHLSRHGVDVELGPFEPQSAH